MRIYLSLFLGLLALPALAGRNTAGTYALPPGNPVQSGTVISSTWANSTMGDLATEMTNSLSRDGYGGMRGPLKLPIGSAPQPALTFTSDPASGLYIAANSDLRMCTSSTDVMRWSSTEVRSYKAFKVSSGGVTVDAGGLTVTAGGATISAGGVTVTTGNLAVSSGSATIGNGLTVTTGGATIAAGGATVTAGGVTATGATSSGAGGTFTGGVSNGPGLVAQGTGTGVGVYANGGGGTIAIPTEGTSAGGVFISNQLGANGLFAWGTDVGSGVYGRGGASGAGVYGVGAPGGKFAASVAATGSAPTNAVELTNGNLKLSGTAPNPSQAIPNVLGPTNMVKAWGVVSTSGTGAATLIAGFNVSGVAINSQEVRVTFATPFTPAPSGGNPTYLVMANAMTQAEAVSPLPASFTTTTVDLRSFNTTTGATVNLSTNGRYIFFMALGAQ